LLWLLLRLPLAVLGLRLGQLLLRLLLLLLMLLLLTARLRRCTWQNLAGSSRNSRQ